MIVCWGAGTNLWNVLLLLRSQKDPIPLPRPAFWYDCAIGCQIESTTSGETGAPIAVVISMWSISPSILNLEPEIPLLANSALIASPAGCESRGISLKPLSRLSPPCPETLWTLDRQALSILISGAEESKAALNSPMNLLNLLAFSASGICSAANNSSSPRYERKLVDKNTPVGVPGLRSQYRARRINDSLSVWTSTFMFLGGSPTQSASGFQELEMLIVRSSLISGEVISSCSLIQSEQSVALWVEICMSSSWTSFV